MNEIITIGRNPRVESVYKVGDIVHFLATGETARVAWVGKCSIGIDRGYLERRTEEAVKDLLDELDPIEIPSAVKELLDEQD